MRTLLAGLVLAAMASAAPVRLRCDHMESPLGIDSEHPRLSWQNDSTERNWTQSAFEIWVAKETRLIAAGQGGRLGQRQAELFRVRWNTLRRTATRREAALLLDGARVWDANGKPSNLATPAVWETGLLNKKNWTAQWIMRKNPEDAADRAGMRWIWVGRGARRSACGSANCCGFSRIVRGCRGIPDGGGLICWRAAMVRVQGERTRCRRERAHWDSFDRQDIRRLLMPGRKSK